MMLCPGAPAASCTLAVMTVGNLWTRAVATAQPAVIRGQPSSCVRDTLASFRMRHSVLPPETQHYRAYFVWSFQKGQGPRKVMHSGFDCSQGLTVHMGKQLSVGDSTHADPKAESKQAPPVLAAAALKPKQQPASTPHTAASLLPLLPPSAATAAGPSRRRRAAAAANCRCLRTTSKPKHPSSSTNQNRTLKGEGPESFPAPVGAKGGASTAGGGSPAAVAGAGAAAAVAASGGVVLVVVLLPLMPMPTMPSVATAAPCHCWAVRRSCVGVGVGGVSNTESESNQEGV